MNKISEILNQCRNLIKDLVTADNTESIAKVTKSLDEVENEANTMATENTSLKDKIVDMVKNSIVSTNEPSQPTQEETPKSLDEIMIEEANKIVSDKGGK